MREDLDGERPRGRMKRLSAGWYRGQAFVHWTFTVKDRRTGWLDTVFHARFRELHLHALARYRLLAMSYCLMPDHLHLLWGGLANDSDQDEQGQTRGQPDAEARPLRGGEGTARVGRRGAAPLPGPG